MKSHGTGNENLAGAEDHLGKRAAFRLDVGKVEIAEKLEILADKGGQCGATSTPGLGLLFETAQPVFDRRNDVHYARTIDALEVRETRETHLLRQAHIVRRRYLILFAELGERQHADVVRILRYAMSDRLERR